MHFICSSILLLIKSVFMLSIVFPRRRPLSALHGFDLTALSFRSVSVITSRKLDLG